MALPLQSRFIILQWAIGLIGSWLCVWIFGPWFVNSILVRVQDAELQSVTLREGDRVRWRSEGWATTLIGPHGLPGWRPSDAATRMVVWGDSQVEGLCVEDEEKIAAQCIQLAAEQYWQTVDCLPMGRSGSDAGDWARTIERADRLWTPVLHVWVVTELSDLFAIASEQPEAPVRGTWSSESSSLIRLSKRLGADALFQAARKMFFDPETGSVRSLRWSVGPDSKSMVKTAPTPMGPLIQEVCQRVAAINDRLHNRLLIVYVPAVPRIMNEIDFEHPDDPVWNAFEAAIQDKVSFIDLRTKLSESWRETGRFARGFHNGTPSDGHLNREGNRIIASGVVDWMNRHGVFGNSAQASL